MASIEDDVVLDAAVDALQRLGLHHIDDDWTNAIWDSQFTESPPLPHEFENYAIHEVDAVALLDQACSCAQEWISAHENDRGQGHNESTASVSETAFWTTITERGIQLNTLIAVIQNFLSRGQKLEAVSADRELALKSSSLYFIMLAVPGSGAYKVFHPVLFNKSLDVFKLALKLHLARFSPKKRRKGPTASQKSRTASSQPSQTRPRKRHLSRASSTSSLQVGNDDDMDDSDADDDAEPGQLSQGEIQTLTNSLNKVLYHFLVFLDHSSLKRSIESLETSIQELVDLTHLETEFANLDFGHKQRRSGVSALAFNAYSGLEKICKPMHGEVKRNVRLVYKALMNGVLMTHRGSSEIAPKGLVVIREHALHFIKHLMKVIGPDSFEAGEILAQHLALRVPDRAEFRSKASAAIVDIMRGLPGQYFRKIVRWIISFAHSEKVSQRHFAVEVMGRLMNEDEREIQSIDEERGEEEQEEENKGQQDMVSHKFIFAVIFSRCRDIAATVRAKALQTLAEITQTTNPIMAAVIQNLIQERGREDREAPPRRGDEGVLDFAAILDDPDIDLASINPLPSSDVFFDFLRKRALDESVYVRKNALQVLENILRLSGDALSEELVRVLAEHCRDSSLMVRKQMVTSLTELVKAFPDNDMVIHHWVEGVFPLILDVEQKATEKVLECIWICLFDNLVKYSAAFRCAHFLPWKILKESESLKMTTYLSRACATWAKDQKLKPGILVVLKSHVHTDNNDYAWLLLSLITAHLPLQDPHFVMDYFNTSIHTPEGVGLYTLLQVLRVLMASVKRLSREEQSLLQKDLILLVQRFALPPELIPTAVDIATIVSQIEAGDNHKRYQSSIDGWAVEIIELIDKELSAAILDPSLQHVESARMMRQIFTLGELAQICPTRMNQRLFLLLQSIIFQQGTRSRKKKKTSEEGEGFVIPGSQTQSTQPPECAFTPTTKLQALAIITLAKMCLQNEDMAKKIIPAFGLLLSTTSDVAIKNNIMYALSDMCVRYASLVDPLLSQMTACLKDTSLTVRRTTLITLIHLLQEDYLKMSGRGAFFFRIIQTLGDENEELRHLATFYLQQRLLKRSPRVMQQHFIEAIFHFNEYEGHQTYKLHISEDEKKLFFVGGVENAEHRMKLYKFMLENMNDEQRFTTAHKLCQDILGGVVEGEIKIEANSTCLLKDALACLACEEIKLASLKSRHEDVEEGNSQEEKDPLQMATTAAKKTIISQVVKKNTIENIIPIVISLKHKLEEQKSPLLNDLMSCLRELMKDYKNEVKDILSADKQLASEIEYDLKRWEEEQRKAEEARRESQFGEEASAAGEGEGDNQFLRRFLQTALTEFKKKKVERERRRSLGEPEEGGRDKMEEFLATQKSSDIEKLQDVLSPSIRLQNVRDNFKKPRDRRGHAAKKGLMEEFSNSAPESAREIESAESAPRTAPAESQEEAVEMDVDPSPEEDKSVHDEEGEMRKQAEDKEIAGEVPNEVGGEIRECSRNAQSEERKDEDENMEVVDQASDKAGAEADMEAASSSAVDPEGNEANSSRTRLMAAPRLPAQTASNRAISTPNKNQSVLAGNITFLERSHELSAIPVLTPPTAPRARTNTRPSQANADSPRFIFARRDAFEDLVDERHAFRAEEAQQPPQDDAEPPTGTKGKSTKKN